MKVEKERSREIVGVWQRYKSEGRARDAERFGRTEVIENTLNPEFVRKFILDYFFEERQNLRFDLYDVDSKSPNLSKHDFLGQAFCTLGEVVGSLGSRMEKPLVFTICHKTEVVKNTLNPVWQAFKIPVRALCNGDYDSHDFIGEFSTSYRELSRGQSQFNVYEVVNPKKKGKKKKYLNSGTVTLLSFLVDIEVTFLDYIKGGILILIDTCMEIHLISQERIEALILTGSE
ncbi:unnamed protein product [Coregonus sp. 'balchen']|nr:unnamed protein product [Coregonus sp. 'balchen']